MTAQLDLFLDNSDESLYMREVTRLQDYVTRSNRAQFGRMNDLGKQIVKMNDEIERLRGMLIKEMK